MMTFEQFQATGRDVDDVEIAAHDGDHRPGRVYAGETYIELNDEPRGGRYRLVLMHDAYLSDDLAALERTLYDFAVSEGAFG